MSSLQSWITLTLMSGSAKRSKKVDSIVLIVNVLVHRKRMTIQDSLQHPWIKVGLATLDYDKINMCCVCQIFIFVSL